MKGLSKLKYDAHNPRIDNPTGEYSMRPYTNARSIKFKVYVTLVAQSEGGG